MKQRILKVFVYRNLHSKEKLFSVRDINTGLVITHSKRLLLQNCYFKVLEKGRQRFLMEGHRNVHAGVQGYLVIDPYIIKDKQADCVNFEVEYNPEVCGKFVTVSVYNHKTIEVNWAEFAFFDNGKVYVQYA